MPSRRSPGRRRKATLASELKALLSRLTAWNEAGAQVGALAHKDIGVILARLEVLLGTGARSRIFEIPKPARRKRRRRSA